ncbi:MAG: amidohydrolase [Lachnospiraceae bacterium]|nr:amidohydrolase [Lachnospiraceae bacterium]
MNVRFYNAKLLLLSSHDTMGINETEETAAEKEEIFIGEVWVEGNRITFAGTHAEALQKSREESDIRWDREMDCEGNLLMPGFKNAHTHSPMTFLRSFADDMPLQEWLNQQVFPMEAKLTDRDMYELTRLAILEYLTSGVTACFDMYLLTEPRVRAALDCGFRMVICGSVNDFTGSPEQMEQDYIRYRNNQDSLISCQLGFHAEYTTGRDLLEQIAKMADRYQAPVYMHLSETRQEVEACRKRYSMSPVEFLDSCGMFRYGGGGFHCVHVSEQDMEILKERGVFVISNPASNMKLASGIAPIEEMERRGIPIAIGTDGAASNNCLDMFREMYLLTGLQKLSTGNASALPADKVLKMAALNGARAMGLIDCDGIAVGNKADLILIDLHRPNMQPQNHLVKNLVYSGSKENIKLTMVDGKILYEEHQFYIEADPEEIYRKANEIITRIIRA